MELIRRAIHSKDRQTALYISPWLSKSELIDLFTEWVFLASFSHGALQAVREIIGSLPREWVLSNIEGVAEPLLQDATYDEYRRLLELYIELDRDLALRLAKRAADQFDDDIREAGEDFLARLGAQP